MVAATGSNSQPPAGTEAVNSTTTVRPSTGDWPSAVPARARRSRLPMPVTSQTTS